MNLRVYFKNLSSGEMTLDDEVVKDYRYAHGQQLFSHSQSGGSKGCKVLIENVTNASNAWAWVKLPNGTTTCKKLWQGLTLLPKEFVRTSGGFARSGRQRVTEPTTGEVHDSWVWCRSSGICFYEDVNLRVPVYYNPTSDFPTGIPFAIVETYSNVTTTVDKGPVHLPEECPDRSAPPMYDDNTQAELIQLCKPLFDNIDQPNYNVIV